MPSIPPPDESTGAPRPGDVLAGKYEVERVIGSGAMGVVVAAMHLDLGERVALKFLLPQAASNPEVVARFAREARAAAKIKSEHVARVTDVGKLETGAPYMVMEYLEGSDLAGVVRDRGPLPVREAVEHVIQACAAVAEAHALGIIHRDLKPANLFLANRPGGTPIVKVLDFGISKIIPRRDSSPVFDPSVTRTTAWLGSPLYMSPEQMTSAKNVDARTDVWSLGAILYELLTAMPPFDAASLPELFAVILNSPPPSLAKARPDAPAGLGAVIEKSLTKDKEARYANVGELAAALAPFAPSRARSAAERAVAVTEAAAPVAPKAMRRPLDSTMPEELMDPPLGSEAPPRAPLPSVPPPRRGSAPPAIASSIASTIAMESTDARSSAMPSPTAHAPPKRRGGAALFGLALVVAVGAAALYYTKLRHSDPAPSVDREAAPTASAPMAAVSIAPSSAVSSAPTVSIVNAVGASAPSASAPLASAIVDAGIAHDAGPAKLFGRLPSPSATTAAVVAPPKTPPTSVTPSGLDQEQCFATMPDGSRKPIPCH